VYVNGNEYVYVRKPAKKNLLSRGAEEENSM